MQTKRQSMTEIVTNTAVGFIGSWLITILVLYSIDNRAVAGTLTVILCTIWSLIRGYALRRYFNKIHAKV